MRGKEDEMKIEKVRGKEKVKEDEMKRKEERGKEIEGERGRSSDRRRDNGGKQQRHLGRRDEETEVEQGGEEKMFDHDNQEKRENFYNKFSSRIVKNSVARNNMDITMKMTPTIIPKMKIIMKLIIISIMRVERTGRLGKLIAIYLTHSFRPNPMYRWFQFCERGIG